MWVRGSLMCILLCALLFLYTIMVMTVKVEKTVKVSERKSFKLF